MRPLFHLSKHVVGIEKLAEENQKARHPDAIFWYQEKIIVSIT